MNKEATLKLLLLLILWTQSVAISAAVNQQCFDKPENAYAYLMAQEKLSKQQIIADSSLALNINTASEAKLTTLKGIGSHKAQSIIRYRKAHGPFKQVDDLTDVKGIGDKTVAKNRSRLRVND